MSLAEWLSVPCNDPNGQALVRNYEASDEWVSADLVLINDQASKADAAATTVIYNTLGPRTNVIPYYRVFCKTDGSETVGIATLGAAGCDGHRGIVHGGITALLLDNTIGFANAIQSLAAAGELMDTIGGKPIPENTVATFGFTAYLNVNYRAPLRAGTTVVITCVCEKAEGRKCFLKGEVRDTSGTLIADASSLFVKPRPRSN